MKDDRHIVLPLLGVAVFSLLFLFSVSATKASFNGQENPFPDVISMKQIFPPMDAATTQIAHDMRWAMDIDMHAVKKPVLSFLGLENYKYGQTRYVAPWHVPAPQTVAVVQPAVYEQTAPAVLGASTVNPEYRGYKGIFTSIGE